MIHCQFIEQLAATEPVQVLCRVLQISAAGYYQWLNRADRPTPDWEPAARRLFAPGGGSGRKSLRGQPAPTAPNQVCVGDITYLPLVGGRWCYLTTWRDTYSRRVVGWQLDRHMLTDLVFSALEQALTLRQPATGLITPTAVVTIPAWLAKRASKKPRHWLAIAGWVTHIITLKPGRAGAHSKPNCCPMAACLPASKRRDWKWSTTSIPTSTSTDGTPRSATAPRTNSSATFKSTYLSLLSVFTRPPQHRSLVSHY